MKEQLNKAKINHERFSAICGKTLSKKDPHYLKYISSKGRKDLKPAQIGCALSHIHIWEHIANQSGHQAFLILEDDAIVPKDLVSKINETITQVPESGIYY